VFIPYEIQVGNAGYSLLIPCDIVILMQSQENKEMHLAQMRFANLQIVQLIDLILEGVSNPQVIVLQSDHGPLGS
jgi:hypothetical protein